MKEIKNIRTEFRTDGNYVEVFSLGTSDDGRYWTIRRKISVSTEPQYRPFKEGDMIEDGDQYKMHDKWFDFHETSIGQEADTVFWRDTARKLIK